MGQRHQVGGGGGVGLPRRVGGGGVGRRRWVEGGEGTGRQRRVGGVGGDAGQYGGPEEDEEAQEGGIGLEEKEAWGNDSRSEEE